MQNITIMSNGYGSLPYINTVTSCFDKNGFQSNALVFSGQNGQSGCYSIDQAAEEFVNSFEGTDYLYVHCSSLYVLSATWQKNADIFNSVKKIFIYSYLAEPQKHMTRFKEKCARFGTQLAPELRIPEQEEARAFMKAHCEKIELIHPQTAMNKVRANAEDILSLQTLLPELKIHLLEEGYEIEPAAQYEKVSKVVDFAISLTD